MFCAGSRPKKRIHTTENFAECRNHSLLLTVLVIIICYVVIFTGQKLIKVTVSLLGDDKTLLVRFGQLYSRTYTGSNLFLLLTFYKTQLLTLHVQTRSLATSSPVIRNLVTRPEMKVQEAGGISPPLVETQCSSRRL